MNKNGCMLFLVIIFIVSAIVFSISITVRKTSKPAPKTQEFITENEDSGINKNNFGGNKDALTPEMHPYQNSDSESFLSQNIKKSPKEGNSYIAPNNPRFLNNSYGKRSPKPDLLINNMQICKPYTETMRANYMGVDTNYEISIEGWQNGKCILNFTANAGLVNADILSEYGFETSEVNVFVPKIRCEFTKEQLDYAGDVILEENTRRNNPNKRMLKDPNDINFSDRLQNSDLKIIDLLVRQKACKITNLDELHSLLRQAEDFLEM